MLKKALIAATATLAIVGVSAVAAVDAHASVMFSAGNASITGLGDEIDSGFDTFSISGLNGTLNKGSPETIAHLAFTAGYNCNNCTSTPSGLLGFSLQVGSVTQTANLGWAWMSTGPTDTLSITAPGNMTYVQSNGEVDVVSFATSSASLSSGGGYVGGDLSASVAVPEPTSLGLLGAGLVALATTGLIRRRG